jgi:AcrR family transcriptional regulator
MYLYDPAMPRMSRSASFVGPSARIARRQHRTRDALLQVAALQFCRKGIEAVSVEDLITAADVSRATFYSMFKSKYSLLESILNPMFDEMEGALEALAQAAPEHALERVLTLYPQLWRQYREGMRLMQCPGLAVRQRFSGRYRAVEDGLLAVLRQAERAELLRNGSAQFSVRVLTGSAVPLLEAYDGHPTAEALFIDALRGLLLRAH